MLAREAVWMVLLLVVVPKGTAGNDEAGNADDPEKVWCRPGVFVGMVIGFSLVGACLAIFVYQSLKACLCKKKNHMDLESTRTSVTYADGVKYKSRPSHAEKANRKLRYDNRQPRNDSTDQGQPEHTRTDHPRSEEIEKRRGRQRRHKPAKEITVGPDKYLLDDPKKKSSTSSGRRHHEDRLATPRPEGEAGAEVDSKSGSPTEPLLDHLIPTNIPDQTTLQGHTSVNNLYEEMKEQGQDTKQDEQKL